MNKNGFLEVITTARLTMSDDELLEAQKLIQEERRVRRERAFSENKRSLRVGDEVSFINNEGTRVIGEITKIKTKKALVRVGGVSWDVPMGMLSAA
jgi:exosome complex RNA-binding protein Csl4|tara:strand:+ start:727 stop:1014 length:288 start_codon:yes stop_codon:yes gene_type:complete